MATDLLKLAERCEAATGPEKALDREIALAVGWVRQTPSEARRRHPAWFHPDDCRDGQPMMDSLHGTTVWRDPIAYTASLDAAMTLVPEGWFETLEQLSDGSWRAVVRNPTLSDDSEGHAATPALALCAAALRARAAQQARKLALKYSGGDYRSELPFRVRRQKRAS